MIESTMEIVGQDIKVDELGIFRVWEAREIALPLTQSDFMIQGKDFK